MTKLRLSLACSSYDRTTSLQTEEVRPDGIELAFQLLDVEETFFRMLRYQEFDVAELSLSSYAMTIARGNSPFVALPVFPSRMFRQSSIYINAAAGITEPKDLIGKRVGVPEYQMSAPVWIRGLLNDEFDVHPTAVTYFAGGQEETGREEKLKLTLPPGFHVQPIRADQTLNAMLLEGEIDALYTARTPSCYYSHPDRVCRLFEDYVRTERSYFAKTGIFPIMHVIAVRRDVYERDRWIARSLYKAFVEAQRLTYDRLLVSASLTTMLPWQIAGVEEVIGLMGTDWWPYGIEKNRAVIDTFTRYHHEQGLSSRKLTIEELFAPETFGEFKI